MKKTLYILTIATTALFTACNNDDDDIFSQTATERMNNRLNETAQVLENAEYGWALDYYPGANIEYGGIAYTVSFDGLNATVRSELDPSREETSLYKFKSDDGAILSFDTYNVLLHYFATPSADEYQAQGGDFEFLIDSIATNVVKLHGKRNGNTVWLHRLTQPAEEYIKHVVDLQDSLFIDAIALNGQKLGRINIQNRHIYTSDDDENGIPFVITNNGFRLYENTTLGSNIVSDFVYNDNDLSLTDIASNTKFSVQISADVLPKYIVGSSNGETLRFTVRHINEITFGQGGDWYNVTTEGNELIVEIAENQSGYVHKAYLPIEMYGRTDSILISDMFGEYYLSFKDNNGNSYVEDAQLIQDEDGEVVLSVPSLDYIFPMSLDVSTFTLSFKSHSFVGTFTNAKGTTYYLGTQLITKELYWTSHYDGYEFGGQFTDTEEDGTIIEFNQGEVVGYNFTGVQIGAYSSSVLTSANYLGWFDRIWNPILTKK